MDQPLKNPFVGPRPLEPGEPLYGREREIGELVLRLNAERIVLLHSPSGAGKSSLVQAGLLPRLKGSFDVWGPTRVNTEPEIAYANRYTLSALRGFEEQVPDPLRRPVDVLAGQTLSGYFDKRPRRRLAPPNVLLVFDQFEEILTVDPLDLDAKRELFDQLGQLLRNPRVWALFVLREDYLAPLDPFARQVPTQLRNRFRIELLEHDAAREAIIQTAREGGREFPAVEDLIRDLAMVKVQQADGSFVSEIGPHVEPVQLQVVCQRLWDAMPEGDLSIGPEDLRQFGNVTEALAAYYKDSVARIAGGDPAVERAIRDWFGEKLITAAGVRGQVLRETGASGGLANETIDQLRATHLVRAESRAGATWYELAHDRLIEPVQRDNAVWRGEHLDPAQRQAALWELQGRPPELLLAGAALAEASRWEEENAARVTGVERRFLAESRKAQEQTDKDRRYILRRWLALGASLVALVALLWGWSSYTTVKRERSRTASRELALRSSQLLDRQPGLAAVLALEAGRLSPTIEARRSLFAAVHHNPRLWRLLPGRQEKRRRVAFQPGGSILAVAGESEVVELWDLQTGWWVSGSPLLPLAGAFEVRALAFSPDGRWLAAGGKTEANAGLLGLWDVSVRPPRRYATPRPGTVVRSLAFCRQGGETRLAWNTKDEVSLWPLRGTEKPRVLRKGPRVARIALTLDCSRLAVGSEWEGAVELWNFPDSSFTLARQPLAEKVPGLRALAFDSAGQRLAAAAKGSDVSLWDLATLRHSSLNAKIPVRTLAFRPDGKILAGAGEKGIALLDLEAETLLSSFLDEMIAEGNELSDLESHREDLELLLSVAGDFLVKREMEKPKPLDGHDGLVPGIAFNEKGDVLASAGSDGKLILWKPDSRQRLGRFLEGSGHGVWAVAFAPWQDSFLLSAEGWIPGQDRPGGEEAVFVNDEETDPTGDTGPAADGSVRLWNVSTRETTVLPGSPGPSRAVAFSPDARWIAAGSREGANGTLHLWRIDEKRSGKAVETARWNAEKPINAVAFTPDGRFLLASEGENLVRWDLRHRLPVRHLLATHPGNVWSFVVRPSTGTLLASDETGAVSEWDVATGESKAVLETVPASLKILAAVAESPDGRLVAAAGWEGDLLRCVYLWEIPSRKFLGCLAGHQQPVSAVAFARDGLLVSADDGGLLIFWDPQTRQEIGRLQHERRVNGLSVSQSRNTLAAASSDGTVLLLDLDWKRAAWSLAGRDKLTLDECETWVSFEPRPKSCLGDERGR
jgi:WD40 repeat protein